MYRKRLARAALLAAMAVLTVNIFTGSPLLALWLGSQVQPAGPPTMAAFAVLTLSLAVNSVVLVKLVTLASRSYDALLDRRPTIRAHLPWLRSMRGERPHETGPDGGALTALDVILVSAVVLVAIAFEVWLLLYAGSPIDQRSGR